MKIAVIGVGGVGGYIGAKLAAVGSKDLAVCFVARGEHLKAIQERGLTVQSRDFAGGKINVKPWIATDRLGDLWQAEVFIVTVKGYDLAKVALDLKPLVKKETVILPLLNGADIYDRLRSFPMGLFCPVVYIYQLTLGRPGQLIIRVRQAGLSWAKIRSIRILFLKPFYRSLTRQSLIMSGRRTLPATSGRSTFLSAPSVWFLPAMNGPSERSWPTRRCWRSLWGL